MTTTKVSFCSPPPENGGAALDCKAMLVRRLDALAHESFAQQMVEFHRGEWSLVRWCRWCSDLKTYEVRDGKR